MANSVWPGALPALPLKQGFTGSMGNNIVSSPNDLGEPKLRRRTTKRNDPADFTLRMSTAQLGIFRAFVSDELGDGAKRFDSQDPIFATAVTYRFRDMQQSPPKWVPAAAPGMWDVSLSLVTV